MMKLKKRNDKLDWIAGVVDHLEEHFRPEGFKRSSKFKVVRKQLQCIQAYGLVWRFPNRLGTPRVFLTPFVHANFPEALEIARAIRGHKLNDLPSVGGALGLFSPEQSLMEWPLDNKEEIPRVAESLWPLARDWAFPFWETYISLESTIASHEAVPRRYRWQPHWEDMIGVYYASRGLRAAMMYLEGLPPDRVSASEKHKAAGILSSWERKKGAA